ncbi:glycosyltransferase family A protein [Marinilabiliaceae bacterium ANBcel2]|nr:glycosyltransferase family A protein [Marinilabiliaceae bacterium ANBcel2]
MLTSIIIPCYNVENYIEECVHSAIAQTYPHIEVICIDNNSTDNTWQKLEALKKQYPQLIIDKEPKPGAPAARNKGLQLSKGEWLQFLDADDLLLPGKIEHQVKLIQQQNNVCFIAGACFKRHIHGTDITSTPYPDNPFKSLFATKLGITSSNLWNRKQIEAIGGWDETLKSSQEADLMFRLLQVNENVVFDSEPLTIVRERPEGQISQQNHSEKWLRYFNKRLEMLSWIKTNKPKLFKSDKSFFEDSLFGILKIMANEDLVTANSLYTKHLKGYKPSTNQSHSTGMYLRLYRLFGFRGAETLRKWLGS